MKLPTATAVLFSPWRPVVTEVMKERNCHTCGYLYALSDDKCLAVDLCLLGHLEDHADLRHKPRHFLGNGGEE